MNDVGVALSQWRWPVLIVYNIVGSMQGIVWGTFNVNPDEVRQPLTLPLCFCSVQPCRLRSAASDLCCVQVLSAATK